MHLNCIAIEDENIIQMLLKRLFSRKLTERATLLGIAKNAKEGFQLINEHKDELDVIFLDMILPDKNGLELLEEVDLPETVQVIIMSGDDHVEEQIETTGIADAIVKPFDAARIEEALQKAESAIKQINN